MTLNIFDVQEALLSALKSGVPHRVEELSIPDSDSVLRDSRGKVTPYIAVQVGDLQVDYEGRGLISNRYDDYELPIYIQCVAGDAKGCRKMASQVYDALLGYKASWTGQVRKRPGGLMWPLLASNGATEAYMFPTSFAVTVQLAEV